MKLGILMKPTDACNRYKATLVACIPEGRMGENTQGNLTSHPEYSAANAWDHVISPG